MMSELTPKQVIEMATKGISLAGAKLVEIDLSGVDLSPKAIGGPCEKSVNLGNSFLMNSNLIGVNLSESYLGRANLTGADIYRANLSNANLNGANLHVVDLSLTDLSNAKLIKANLVAAKLLRANLSGADLSKADLNHANLHDADLNKSSLYMANLNDTDLSGANLINADLNTASFVGADLTNANISGVKNVCGINRSGWKINGITCTHVYNCEHRYDRKKGEDSETFINRVLESEFFRKSVKKRWDNDPKRQEKLKAKGWIQEELKKGCSCDHLQLAEYMYMNFPLECFEKETDYQRIIKETFKEVFGKEVYKRITNSKGFHKLPPCPIH